jgi:hypothetical protein
MNDPSARKRRSEKTSGRRLFERSTGRGRLRIRELERLRAGIWAALEALEYGDQRLACDLLLALVEEGDLGCVGDVQQGREAA